MLSENVQHLRKSQHSG